MTGSIRVEARLGASAAARRFTYRGECRFVVAAKTAFPFGATPALREPPALRVRDEISEARFLPTELAPYLGCVDVLVYASPRPAPLRLKVRRAQQVLMDKTVPGDAPLGLGAVPASSSVRSARLGVLDPRMLAAEPCAVPPSFDWSYFQAAPPDQQLPNLSGDEVVSITSYDPAKPTEVHVPPVRARARVVAEGLPPQEFELAGDTIQLHLDEGFAVIVWRATWPSSGREGDVTIEAWLEPIEAGHTIEGLLERGRARANEDTPETAAPRTMAVLEHLPGAPRSMPFTSPSPSQPGGVPAVMPGMEKHWAEELRAMQPFDGSPDSTGTVTVPALVRPPPAPADEGDRTRDLGALPGYAPAPPLPFHRGAWRPEAIGVDTAPNGTGTTTLPILDRARVVLAARERNGGGVSPGAVYGATPPTSAAATPPVPAEVPLTPPIIRNVLTPRAEAFMALPGVPLFDARDDLPSP